MTRMITIFTPTYNRAYTLERLYDSLVKQTDKRFLWLIVDDGSTDNTTELVKKWIKDDQIHIQYEYQENQGKSMAHNRGVELTQTELFTCVDSDDFLIETTVAEVLDFWGRVGKENIGILSRRSSSSGFTAMKLPLDDEIVRTTLKNAYDHLGLVGDTMLIYKTNIIKKYAFPRFDGERFVPEGYLYDLLDQEGTLAVLDKAYYICEYLEDGYTHGMAKLLKRNPRGYLAYINQRLRLDTSIKDRTLDTIRYTAMAIACKKKKIVHDAVYPILAFITYPLGWLFYQRRYKGV